jgi:F-type H+-transporting ATPase subunit delta
MFDHPTEPAKLQTHVTSVLEDPSSQAVARVYADALVNAAGSASESVLDELTAFVDGVLARHPDFDRLLTSPMIGRDDKLKVLDRVVGGRGSELFANFLRVLARHDRLDLLSLILNQSRALLEARSGRKHVLVTSARSLSERERRGIEQRLQSEFAFQPALEVQVDPALLGGLVIRVGDTVYDSSLRTRLKQLRGRLRQRSLHEIQSGRDRFSSAEGN